MRVDDYGLRRPRLEVLEERGQHALDVVPARVVHHEDRQRRVPEHLRGPQPHHGLVKLERPPSRGATAGVVVEERCVAALAR